ncbi:Peptide methionine sulfoxide reductase [Mycena indigotica]|uniref:peptide-methionine (S)-S-oxide reductase n=1 Tax=Mycena indigotica TaxID=2126181 RepID=A0A8H6VSZ3_9AGAR|nr:Peptide methionine sulfoxide reductase [Mycena indigotica]KAF7288918.1 Peptide methionine sulfoxide reductase [Mycena indigotica]
MSYPSSTLPHEHFISPVSGYYKIMTSNRSFTCILNLFLVMNVTGLRGRPGYHGVAGLQITIAFAVDGVSNGCGFLISARDPVLYLPPLRLSSTILSSPSMTSTTEVAIFASGCFWGTEHIFVKHFPPAKGILKTTVGYTGGKETSTNPDYRTVCSGATGHAEAVRIEFNPNLVSYAELVEFFYRTHDPTTENKQGPDVGTQYRSAIFTTTAEQAATAKRVTEEVQAKHFAPNVSLSRRLVSMLLPYHFPQGTAIVTQIQEAGPWWDAEEYHQLYLFNNPNGYQCPTHRLHW